MNLVPRRTHDVFRVNSINQQGICDERTMTAPRNRFGAHQRDLPLVRQLDRFVEALRKLGRMHVGMCGVIPPSSSVRMARYKYIDTHPRLLAIDLSRQLLPGTFEHALNYLLDHAIDLSHFDARFRNDETGAPAYLPALLLKVVLFAYSQGIISSRQIARACEEHVTAESAPRHIEACTSTVTALHTEHFCVRRRRAHVHVSGREIALSPRAREHHHGLHRRTFSWRET